MYILDLLMDCYHQSQQGIKKNGCTSFASVPLVPCFVICLFGSRNRLPPHIFLKGEMRHSPSSIPGLPHM